MHAQILQLASEYIHAWMAQHSGVHADSLLLCIQGRGLSGAWMDVSKAVGTTIIATSPLAYDIPPHSHGSLRNGCSTRLSVSFESLHFHQIDEDNESC